MTSVVDHQDSINQVSQWTTYEFPLNERIRTLLRLEDLFNKFTFFVSQDHKLDHHAALLTLFEIIEVGSRADLKSDLIQELDKQKQMLTQLHDHPSVDTRKLNQTLVEVDRVTLNLT
ncbi:MAG: cell division protein ZapD, partial [Limnobacter sp.]|nr:cell division protein ZapD [Limnobacter sp.]